MRIIIFFLNTKLHKKSVYGNIWLLFFLVCLQKALIPTFKKDEGWD